MGAMTFRVCPQRNQASRARVRSTPDVLPPPGATLGEVLLQELEEAPSAKANWPSLDSEASTERSESSSDRSRRHKQQKAELLSPPPSGCVPKGRRARCAGVEAPEDMDAWHRATCFSEAVKCLATDANGASVTKLALVGVALTDEEASRLADHLHSNPNVLRLALVECNLGDQAAEHLAEALAANDVLTSLSLEGNRVGDRGAGRLANALQRNEALTSLSLGRNCVGNQGVKQLLDALENNYTLRILDLTSNSVSRPGWSIAGDGRTANQKRLQALPPRALAAGADGFGEPKDSTRMRDILQLWEKETRALVDEIVVPDFLSCSFDKGWEAVRLEMVTALHHVPQGLPRFPEALAELPKYPWLEKLFSLAKTIQEETVVHRHEGQWHLAGDFHGMKALALQPKHLQPETKSCFFGYINMFYIVAWWYALSMDFNEATLYLQLISQLLKKGQLDWTEHSGWPITSWSVYLNIQRMHTGMPFSPLPADPTPVHPLSHLVPAVWPLPGSRHYISKQPLQPQSISVFYIAMHVVPFNDFLTFLDEWWQTAGGADASSVKIYANYMGFPRCCPGVGQACSQKDLEAAVPMQKDWRIPYCCQDEHLYSLIGVPRLHDHSQGQWEGAYRNHRNDHWSDVKQEFAAKYYDWMNSHVDLVLCGHPIFWCTLFEDLLRANHKKSMIAVYDQPPFFLVPEDGEDDFAERLQALADPEFQNAVVVGFAPFFTRQFEWLFGRKIPHSRPIALVVKDVWQPLQPDSVLFSTSIDAEAIGIFFRYAEENVIVDPSGLQLRFLEWGLDAAAKNAGRTGLSYETPKSELAQLRCVVVTPYDFAHFKLPEFKAMGMPMFMHSQLWKWTTRWSQMISRPAGRNASQFADSRWHPPHECYTDLQTQELQMPTLPESFYTDPWGFLPDERPCAKALSQWDDHAGPFGRSPFQLFTIDRRDLQPLDGTLFWSQWSEMSLLPYTIYFDSAAHLIALLRHLPLEALMDLSRATRHWYRQEAYQVVEFWRGLTVALLGGDAATFKGVMPRQ
ncbi:NLRC3 [Symbiodinium sp. CCMP2456]|nr:NLRC3 [Symbiodinium sp. CCMP2456]